MPRLIYEIAIDIERDMRSVTKGNMRPSARFFAAWPYLQAAKKLDHVTDSFGAENAKSVVRYLLSNLSGYRGDNARRFKAELKELIG